MKCLKGIFITLWIIGIIYLIYWLIRSFGLFGVLIIIGMIIVVVYLIRNNNKKLEKQRMEKEEEILFENNIKNGLIKDFNDEEFDKPVLNPSQIYLWDECLEEMENCKKDCDLYKFENSVYISMINNIADEYTQEIIDMKK